MIKHFLAIDKAKEIDALRDEVITYETAIDKRLSGKGKTVEVLARKMLQEIAKDD